MGHPAEISGHGFHIRLPANRALVKGVRPRSLGTPRLAIFHEFTQGGSETIRPRQSLERIQAGRNPAKIDDFVLPCTAFCRLSQEVLRGIR